jgi:simple sugar transport system permease protein
LRIKILGSNPDYLVSLGYDVRKTMVLTFMLSGAIAGLTAALYYHGSLYRIEYPLEYNTASYGYLAILVAWLSMLDVYLVPLSAYIVSAVILGSQRVSSLPSVREAFIRLQLGGAEMAFKLLMFGSILLAYSILRFIQDYELKVVS